MRVYAACWEQDPRKSQRERGKLGEEERGVKVIDCIIWSEFDIIYSTLYVHDSVMRELAQKSEKSMEHGENKRKQGRERATNNGKLHDSSDWEERWCKWGSRGREGTRGVDKVKNRKRQKEGKRERALAKRRNKEEDCGCFALLQIVFCW